MNETEDARIGGSEGEKLQEWERKAWRRLAAGLLVEQGLGDKGVAKRWHNHVKAGDFDPDRFADELLETPLERPDDAESKLLLRTARLERDLLMTPLLRGVSGASRKARGAARTGVAAMLTQLMVLGIYSMLIFLFLLVLSFKGVQLDPFFQSILDAIPALPEATS
jgi:hypothetical protein